MSQNDFVIANQTAPNFRADLNDALQALASLSSGSTEPSTTYANMLWYDTGNNILKMRTEADDAWIDIGYLCQSTNRFCILNDTNVVDSTGTKLAEITTQIETDWESGVSTLDTLVSPAKVKAAIEALGSNIPTAYGAVGTYVFAYNPSETTFNAGSTYSGSNLKPAGLSFLDGQVSTVGQTAVSASGDFSISDTGASSLSGTWRAMGQTTTNNAIDEHPVTLFMRIA